MMSVGESVWVVTLKILEHIEIYFFQKIIKNIDKLKK